MKKRIGTYAILIVALLFIIIGISQNQQHDVFQKAILICLECIGIG